MSVNNAFSPESPTPVQTSEKFLELPVLARPKPSNEGMSPEQQVFAIERWTMDRKIGELTLANTLLVDRADFWQTRAAELEYEVNHDELTGLLNRRALRLDGEQRIADGRAFALGFLDINNFKKVNDDISHEAGDRLLKNIAAVNTREGDTLFRLAGDELVLLVDLTVKNNREPDLFKAIGNQAVHFDQAFGLLIQALPQEIRDCKVGVSTGWALSDPDHPRPLTELMREADDNMYHAKEISKAISGQVSRR